MKIADEFRRACRRNQMTIYYEMLLRDMRTEAREGGTHKIVHIASLNYNTICKKLLNDGFTVMIYNFDENNNTHVTYIIWDKERFDKDWECEEHENIKTHYGLI